MGWTSGFLEIRETSLSDANDMKYCKNYLELQMHMYFSCDFKIILLLFTALLNEDTGWLGYAMVRGSFQCQGVLLLFLHIVGQGSAVLAAGAGRVGYIFHLSSLSINVLSFGRRLNMAEILWFRLLNPNDSCQLLPRTSSLSTG